MTNAVRDLSSFSKRLHEIIVDVEERLPKSKRTSTSVYSLREDAEEMNTCMSLMEKHIDHYNTLEERFLREIIFNALNDFDYLSQTCKDSVVNNLVRKILKEVKSNEMEEMFYNLKSRVERRVDVVAKVLENFNTKDHLNEAIHEVIKKK